MQSMVLEILLILTWRDVGVLFEDANKILVVTKSDILRDGVDFVIA